MGSLNDQSVPGDQSAAAVTVGGSSSSRAALCEHSHAKAWRSPAAWATLLLVLSIGLGVDLASKYWSFANVAPWPVILDRKTLLEDPDWNVPHHEGVEALPWGLLDFQLVINRGAVFGIGANRRFFFIAFTLGALVAGVWVFSRTHASSRMAHVAIGLILAGGVGNLYDRIVYGVVRDFLHMLPGRELPFGMTWPGGSPELFPWVFNIADVMLLTGMGLLILHMHRHERNAARVKANATASMQPAAAPDQPA